MISRSEQAFVRSLQQKKFREKHSCFVAEGNKLVKEFLSSDWDIKKVYADHSWSFSEGEAQEISEITRVSSAEMERISGFTSPGQVLAVIGMKEKDQNPDQWISNYTLLLDDIRDPGNLGTMIRIADWFGIRQIICSPSTVELYNPKVIQASMGSVIRVNVLYSELSPLLESESGTPAIATALDGSNLFETELPGSGFLLTGSESHGLSPLLAALAGFRVFIPPFPSSVRDIDSLNAAVSTGILCAELRRRSGSEPSAACH